MKLEVVKLAQELIAYQSITQTSNVGIALYLSGLLKRLGFQVEEIPFVDPDGVDKISLVAKLGKGRGGLTLMSHDDVVPARREDGWTSDPFKGRIRQGRLYGRGACDMKGPLAATLAAASRFRAADLKAPLFLAITADEEVMARGAREVVRRSRLFNEASSGYGIICEPTRLQVVHAHKGALSIVATAHGRAAHTSTLKGINANVRMIPFLVEMKRIYDLVLTSRKYRNDAFSPPHSEWSIGINDFNVATNISPMRSVCTINYRPMPGVDVKGLIRRTRKSARRHGLTCEVFSVGDPLYTPPDSPLVRLALKLTGRRRPRTVPYGTDGMLFVKKMKELIVLGPGSIAQAHTVDEWIDLDELRQSVELYARFIEQVCGQGKLRS